MATGRGPATMRMYHVTNVRASAISRHAFVTIGDERHAISVATKEPDWSEVRLCVPNDEYYDGPLCGLPVACFSTTLYKGELPTFSPYPRDAAPGTEHWRVSVPFNPDDYKIFLMHVVETPQGRLQQVHLLCLTKSTCRSDGSETLLKDLFKSKKMWPTKLQKDEGRISLETCFPGDNPNEYSNPDPEKKFFVNVHFVKPVPLSDKTAEWTPVEKQKYKDEYFMAMARDRIAKGFRKDWIVKTFPEKHVLKSIKML